MFRRNRTVPSQGLTRRPDESTDAFTIFDMHHQLSDQELEMMSDVDKKIQHYGILIKTILDRLDGIHQRMNSLENKIATVEELMHCLLVHAERTDR